MNAQGTSVTEVLRKHILTLVKLAGESGMTHEEINDVLRTIIDERPLPQEAFKIL
mgnify:CR=1 FL=1